MMTVGAQLFRGDVGEDVVDLVRAAGISGWDIETSGLDPKAERIGTCQVAVGDEVFVVQLDGDQVPRNLLLLLEDPTVTKVFHHAPFDLRFLAHHWKARPLNVACTKIAAKIAEPGLDGREYSLKPVLLRHLDIALNKGEQRSDWTRDQLTDAQINYAARDVAYLADLLGHLEKLVADRGVSDLLQASFHYLPARVRLDLDGPGDVFAY